MYLKEKIMIDIRLFKSKTNGVWVNREIGGKKVTKLNDGKIGNPSKFCDKKIAFLT